MDVWICGDVLTIVQDDKRVPKYRGVERDGDGCEQNAEDRVRFLFERRGPAAGAALEFGLFRDLGTRFRRESWRGSFRLEKLEHERRFDDRIMGFNS